MLYSLSQKAQKYENKLLFDICLLRVKEPFIEPVNFARLPKMVIVVKGNHVIDPKYNIQNKISQNKFFFRWQGMFNVRMGHSTLPKFLKDT